MFYINSVTKAILASALFVGNSGAARFVRTAPDVSPFSTPYTMQTGISNLTASQVPSVQFTDSWWTIYFLHGSNGHDYFAVGNVFGSANSTTGEISTSYRVSLTDINDKYFYGETLFPTGDKLLRDTFSYKSDSFENYALSSDLVTTMFCRSIIPGAEFSLVSTAKGPNVYAGGNGHFQWGNDWTYEFAVPEQWVSGNITYKGEVIDVVPEKSISWFDRQYGPGFGNSGWNLWILLFDNGFKTTIWHSDSVDNGPKQYFATLMAPDGTHEIHPIEADIHPSGPFVSNRTGFTYYAKHKVNIPGIASLDIEQPVLGGEMAPLQGASGANTLYEGYSDVTGVINGRRVRGWGVSERAFGGLF